jgi:hypothetical protein
MSDARGQIEYKNGQYGFCFALPQSWKGYTIVTLHWDGSSEDEGPELGGPLLLIRHPAWTKEEPLEGVAAGEKRRSRCERRAFCSQRGGAQSPLCFRPAAAMELRRTTRGGRSGHAGQ